MSDAVAIDCEMAQLSGGQLGVIKVSIVDSNCEVLYDEYVEPDKHVLNYNTSIHGITASHLAYAKSLNDVRNEVSNFLRGKKVVGHAVDNDLRALGIDVSEYPIRDTADRYKKESQRSSLKDLARKKLGISIQTGKHSSVEDAQACMRIYQSDSSWN